MSPVTVFSAALGRDGQLHRSGRAGRSLARRPDARVPGATDGKSLQVYSLDVPDRKLVQLTHEANPIVS